MSQAASGALMLRTSRGELSIPVYVGENEHAGRQITRCTVPPNMGIAQSVCDEGTPAFTQDSASNPSRYRRIEEQTGVATSSLYSWPIQLEGFSAPVGVLQLADVKQPQLLGFESMSMLCSLGAKSLRAARTATAYTRARRYVPGNRLAGLHARSEEPKALANCGANLFIDIVDSRKLYNIGLRHAFTKINSTVCAILDCVREHEGFSLQFQGDSIVAFFGDESADERALHCATTMISRVNELGLNVRVGIEYGRGVLGDVGDHQQRFSAALGDATHRAFELQRHADLNSVLVGGVHKISLVT